MGSSGERLPSSPETSPRPARRKGRGILFAQLFIAAAIILVIWLSFSQNTQLPPLNPPHELVGLEQVSQQVGKEALAAINQLHGLEFTLATGYVAQYRSGGQEATIWAGLAQDTSQASQLIERMTKKLQQGGSPFAYQRSLPMEGMTVNYVTGPGGASFYFSDHAKVFWITTNSPQPVQFLMEAMPALSSTH